MVKTGVDEAEKWLRLSLVWRNRCRTAGNARMQLQELERRAAKQQVLTDPPVSNKKTSGVHGAEVFKSVSAAVAANRWCRAQLRRRHRLDALAGRHCLTLS
jgi:hypothetical protein